LAIGTVNTGSLIVVHAAELMQDVIDTR